MRFRQEGVYTDGSHRNVIEIMTGQNKVLLGEHKAGSAFCDCWYSLSNNS